MATLSIDTPDSHLPRLAAMAERIGPVVLGDRYEAIAGKPAGEALTDAEAVPVAEALLRHYVRANIEAVEAETAAETARKAAVRKVRDDGVVPEPEPRTR